MTATIMLFSVNSGTAQMFPFPGAFGPQYPFFYAPPVNPFYPSLPFLPWPIGMPGVRTAPVQPLLAPMGAPLPMRYAAATITIIFNPALSVVNVSAVPIPAIAPVPTATLVPVPTVVPTVAPTALAALLPVLLATAAPAGPPYTQIQTVSGTVPAFPLAPAAAAPTTTTVVPGLTALLPLI